MPAERVSVLKYERSKQNEGRGEGVTGRTRKNKNTGKVSWEEDGEKWKCVVFLIRTKIDHVFCPTRGSKGLRGVTQLHERVERGINAGFTRKGGPCLNGQGTCGRSLKTSGNEDDRSPTQHKSGQRRVCPFKVG